MFSGEEIREFLRFADYVAVNDYEGKLLEEKTGASCKSWREVKALVCTLGANGSLIFAAGKRHEVPCVRADAVVDPTGCGELTAQAFSTALRAAGIGTASASSVP